MKHDKRPHVDLGLMAMPVFCCLLGAILILILSTKSGQRPPLPVEKIREMLAQITRAQLVIAQSATTHRVLSNRLDFVEYRHANAKLDAQIQEKLREAAELSNKVTQAQIIQGQLDEKQRQAETTAADLAAAQARLADLEAQAKVAKTNDAVGLFGTYRGSLVLLECTRNGATVHPGGRRIASNAPEREFDSVMTEIDRAGFVTIVARPEGFTNSYSRVRRVIKNRLEALNRTRLTPVGFCAFPLPADSPIAAFLPKGGLP